MSKRMEIEVVKPVIEVNYSWGETDNIYPTNEVYDKWAAAISEGFCPQGMPGWEPHRLVQEIDAETGQPWLRCTRSSMLFRLAYDQL